MPANQAAPSIRMGELAVAQGDGVLRTLLGSCIGLILYDRRKKVGGIAHIVLPESRGRGEPPGKFVDTAIPALVAEMEALGGRPLRLEARIAGGANMFKTNVTDTVGRKNIDACERLLSEWKIPIIAQHCGGEQGRRLTLDTSTGVARVEIVGSEPIEL